jgi:hypothetical protein
MALEGVRLAIMWPIWIECVCSRGTKKISCTSNGSWKNQSLEWNVANECFLRIDSQRADSKKSATSRKYKKTWDFSHYSDCSDILSLWLLLAADEEEETWIQIMLAKNRVSCRADKAAFCLHPKELFIWPQPFRTTVSNSTILFKI